MCDREHPVTPSDVQVTWVRDRKLDAWIPILEEGGE